MNDTFSALVSAVSAYRAENPGTSLDARALRERILDAAARRRTLRTRRIAWLLPIAAVLAGSGALAASAPARARVTHFIERLAVVAALSPVERLARSPSHPAARRPPTNPIEKAPAGALNPAPTPLPAPVLDPALAPVPAPVPPVALDPVPAVTLDPVPEIPHLGAPVAAAPARPSPHAPFAATAARVAPSSVADPALAEDLAAYRVAHRFHFALSDYARALKAWDGYLTRFPAGTFAPEARLNRAVCLARLGEAGEARHSLSAIARGTYGKDGRAQATKLLQALEPPKTR